VPPAASSSEAIAEGASPVFVSMAAQPRRGWADALYSYEPRASDELRVVRGMQYIYRGAHPLHVQWAIVERLPTEVGLVPLSYLALRPDGDGGAGAGGRGPLERALSAAGAAAAGGDDAGGELARSSAFELDAAVSRLYVPLHFTRIMLTI
jgi:hypothetical protein